MNIQPFTIVEAFFNLLEMDFIILGSNFYCLGSIIITEDILKFKGYEKIGYKLKVQEISRAFIKSNNSFGFPYKQDLFIWNSLDYQIALKVMQNQSGLKLLKKSFTLNQDRDLNINCSYFSESYYFLNLISVIKYLHSIIMIILLHQIELSLDRFLLLQTLQDLHFY